MEKVIVTVISPDELAALVAEKVLAILSQQQHTAAERPNTAGYLSRKDIAEKLHINLKTVNEWTKTGKLKGYRIGRRVLYKSDEVGKALKAIKTKNE